jgi:glycosyltransferase involved in cell wall biosynthesis
VEDAFLDTRRILRRVKSLVAQGYPVQWRKHISDRELSQAYQNSAFTVFPSRMEGFGLPILESLWHGRPVICGKNGAIGEVAEEGGGCLLIDQNNPQKLAEAIQKLLDDAPLYTKLYGQAQARHFRSWDDYGRDLEKVFVSPPVAA